jgi:small subunit ribosomal protein S20
LANHKSALKRDRQSKTRRARNRVNKTRVNNAVKKTTALIGGEPEALEQAFRTAVKVIHKAKTKGTLHKRTASRRISRLARRVYLAAKESGPQTETQASAPADTQTETQAPAPAETQTETQESSPDETQA